jgi:hypothetical protein
VKNTSADDGDKPEKVYKFDDWDGFSYGWFSGIITSSGTRFRCHPTSRCAWHLHANPRMCMIITQWASHLTTTLQLNRKLGGSR